ncbi:MAG: hypothetical protein JW957_06345 [Candidatus Omnitrophica bacterium]|nr:hypothetical protein [Candidatus Omnitrophota bacterium]
MKKIITVLVILAVAGVVWWKYSNKVKSELSGPQGEPARTVAFFFENVQKLSNLIWKEGAKEQAEADIRKIQSGSAEEREKATAELYKKYGIGDIKILFREEKFGKAVAGTFSLFEFGTYSVGEAKIDGNTAVVEVKFSPEDFMGMNKAFSKLSSVKTQGIKQGTSIIPFSLEKKGHMWYIVDIGGEAGSLAKAASRLGK